MSKFEVLDLLNLPDKAVGAVVDRLNIWNLMNLRLVCKMTKSWVEKPEVLKKFCVHVKERRFLKKVVKSKAKWANLCISCDTSDMTKTWIQSEEYWSVFSTLNTSLRVLKFTEQRLPFKNGLGMILANCTQLEELVIGTLDLARADMPVSELILESVSSLRSLSVSFIAWENEKDLQMIPQLLSHCTKLRFFKIPYILSAMLYSLYPSLDEDEIDQKLADISEEILFKPIKTLLKQQETCSLKYLDVENFEFEHIIHKLAPTCKEAGCLLQNVLEIFERPFTQAEVQLCDTIGSILNCTKHLDLTKLTNLRTVSITEDCVSSTDIDKKYQNAMLPSLRGVNLTLTTSILVSERLASCLLQQKRESVETVSVKFEELKGSAQASVFRSPRFAASLPNLRALTLDGFDGKPGDYLSFWSSFPLLEQLQLQNCTTLTDEALIGEDSNNPAMCNLKNLKSLTLESEDVSHVVIKNVISHFPLEVLQLCLPKVTFSGITGLNSNQIVSSLVVFHCMKPEDCTDEQFTDFLKQFKNLKKHELLF